MPESVSATYGYVSHKDVEDNAVSILKYPNGAIGIAEASFVNSHSPFVIEIQGTEGCLLYGTVDNVISYRTNLVSNENKQQWLTLEQPANRPSAFHQWVEHIQKNTIATENIALAVDLTRLMEASNLSAAAKKSIALDELKPFHK
jgi:1,5-anhydro-D-fructose reductase (1,5-anhydro-D-mannitol-forming)